MNSDWTGNLAKVLNTIRPHKEKLGKGVGGSVVVECPVCKGELQLAFAKSNGHTRALCKTEGCVSLME